jgi:hypothetical protein
MIGGPIENISLAGRQFAVTADADTGRKLGGFENEVQANGDGTGRVIKTRVPWSVSGLAVQITDEQGDQEYLQAIADGTEFVAIGITFASGDTYQGEGIVAGELSFSNQSASASFDLQGRGQLTKQSF